MSTTSDPSPPAGKRLTERGLGRIAPASIEDSVPSPATAVSNLQQEERTQRGWWKYTLGIVLLLATVILWTASNFLASSVFADNTYSKPYFVTYINTAFFIIPIFPLLLRQLYEERATPPTLKSLLRRKVGRYKLVKEVDSVKPDDEEGEGLLSSSAASMLMGTEDDVRSSQELHRNTSSRRIEVDAMTLAETVRLSFEFCILWFLANYFVAACLEYTTVASATILSSTSSIWTLVFGSIIGVERFTLNKLFGVLASLAGVILISSVDIYGNSDDGRGSFPHKTRQEHIIGDAFALFSAIMYGAYSILMKWRIGDESRINMPLFFGLIGLINVALLWPGIIVLHLSGHETFELPPTSRILLIVVINSATSLVADLCWAYSTLLTSPLVVTVGLSLTIPLSLVGQMILNSQSSSAMYWIGAGIVFLSFIFVNYQESKESAVAAPAAPEYDMVPAE